MAGRCSSAVKRVCKNMELDWTQGSLAEGLRLYQAGEFFQAHEAWEAVWLGAQAPEKIFLQALIQVTAAFHHLQRNNRLGASRLLQAALRRLESYPEFFAGFSVRPLCKDIRDRLQGLEAGAPAAQLASVPIRPAVD